MPSLATFFTVISEMLTNIITSTLKRLSYPLQISIKPVKQLTENSVFNHTYQRNP